jgi:crotonobetainyl-CoA:carnitine CoA-transferase CaiB-like acyl-CoA transferase
VLDNFRPGVVERLQITPDHLRAVNDRLITCSLTGYGRTSERAEAAAIDGVVQAYAGAVELAQQSGLTGPVPIQIADLAGGNAAAQAILAALYARAQDGKGRHIELSLVECVLPWLSVVDRSGTLRSPNTITAAGSDGGSFLVQTPLHFRSRLADLLDLTYEDSERYAAQLRAAFATRPATDWIATLTESGIPAALVRGFAEALDDPDVATVSMDGRVLPDSPFVVDGARHHLDLAPPSLGEHQAQLGAWR